MTTDDGTVEFKRDLGIQMAEWRMGILAEFADSVLEQLGNALDDLENESKFGTRTADRFHFNGFKDAIKLTGDVIKDQLVTDGDKILDELRLVIHPGGDGETSALQTVKEVRPWPTALC